MENESSGIVLKNCKGVTVKNTTVVGCDADYKLEGIEGQKIEVTFKDGKTYIKNKSGCPIIVD